MGMAKFVFANFKRVGCDSLRPSHFVTIVGPFLLTNGLAKQLKIKGILSREGLVHAFLGPIIWSTASLGPIPSRHQKSHVGTLHPVEIPTVGISTASSKPLQSSRQLKNGPGGRSKQKPKQSNQARAPLGPINISGAVELNLSSRHSP